MKFKKILFSVSVPFLMFANSCEKKNTPSPEPVPNYDSGQVRLVVESMFNNSILTSLAPTTDKTWDNRSITITNAQIYLSNFGFEELHSERSNILPTPFILNTLDNNIHDLGYAPVKPYKQINLYTGIDDITNNQPNTYSPQLNNPSMWFDTVNHTMKYVHIRITGLVDTSRNKNGLIDAPFDIKLGGSYNQPITLSTNTPAVAKNRVNTISIAVNYAEIIRGLDLSDPRSRDFTSPARGVEYSNILVPNLQFAIK